MRIKLLHQVGDDPKGAVLDDLDERRAATARAHRVCRRAGPASPRRTRRRSKRWPFKGSTIALTTSALAVAGRHGPRVIRVHVRKSWHGHGLSRGAPASRRAATADDGDNPLVVTLIGGETLYGTSTGAAVLDVLRMNETT
jgi:hypothetical protein